MLTSSRLPTCWGLFRLSITDLAAPTFLRDPVLLLRSRSGAASQLCPQSAGTTTFSKPHAKPTPPQGVAFINMLQSSVSITAWVQSMTHFLIPCHAAHLGTSTCFCNSLVLAFKFFECALHSQLCSRVPLKQGCNVGSVRLNHQ